jgi:hypothetical protein
MALGGDDVSNAPVVDCFSTTGFLGVGRSRMSWGSLILNRHSVYRSVKGIEKTRLDLGFPRHT